MRTLTTHIRIDAPREAVWDVLTDFESFHKWNPLILEAEGELAEGSRISVALEAGGKKPFRVRPRIVHLDPGRELRWLGRILIPGLFDGEHVFRLEEGDEGGVHLIHEEHFRGILVPLLWRNLDTDVRSRFDEMNRALKARVEGFRDILAAEREET